MSVTEITGRDIIQGTANGDQLAAVDTGDLLPGQGEIDVFVGNEGADIFIEMMKPANFVPVHFVDFADTIAFAAKHLDGQTKVFAVKKNGDKLL